MKFQTLKFVQHLCSKTSNIYHFAAQKDPNMTLKSNEYMISYNVGSQNLKWNGY